MYWNPFANFQCHFSFQKKHNCGVYGLETSLRHVDTNLQTTSIMLCFPLSTSLYFFMLSIHEIFYSNRLRSSWCSQFFSYKINETKLLQTGSSIVCHHEKLTSYCFWTRYHVPRSWFKQSGNVLVIFEEKGGDPSKIEFSRRKITGVCALVAENYPSIDLESWNEGSGSNETIATVHLGCPEDTHISSVKFASFGNPTGACGSYTQGNCHDPNSISVVEKVSTSNSP